MKGLVLAAGLGKRLRPLTDVLPKPLLPFGGIAPLHLALAKMRIVGITTQAVNTHHLPDAIRVSLTESPLGQGVRISHEPVLMDTGGVFVALRDWAGRDDVLIHNGDIVSTTDLLRAIDCHCSAIRLDTVATMVVLPSLVPGTNPLWCKDGYLVGIGGITRADAVPINATPHTFTGIHIVSAALRDYLPATGPSSILVAYQTALEKGQRVRIIEHPGLWFDLGTPKAYLEAHHCLLQELDAEPLQQNLVLDAFGIRPASAMAKRPFWVCRTNEQKRFEDVTVCGPSFILGPDTPSGNGQLGPWCTISDGPHLSGQCISESVISSQQATGPAGETQRCLVVGENYKLKVE